MAYGQTCVYHVRAMEAAGVQLVSRTRFTGVVEGYVAFNEILLYAISLQTSWLYYSIFVLFCYDS